MKLSRLLSISCLLFGYFSVSQVHGSNNLPTTGSMPDVVFLRTNCGTLANCATTVTELLAWTWNTRQPSATSPLLIAVGPGAFQTQDPTFCDATTAPRGHVTVRGSGRDNTVFFSISRPAGAVITVIGCSELSFQDLTIRGKTGEADWGVEWSYGGNSNWTNVQIEAPGFAWYDSGDGSCAPGLGGRHNWFSSTLKTTGGLPFSSNFADGIIAYHSLCGDAWLWGSEVLNNSSASNRPRTGIKVVGSGAQAHLYGSNVRVSSLISSSYGFTGLFAASGGMIHIHGGEVSTRAEGSGNQSVIGAIATGTGSLVHGHETSWGLLASGTGSATRLSSTGGGKVESSFTWTPATQPPAIISTNGADSFIETDCASAGCQSGGTETHLHIYNSSCTTAGPWFDVVTGRCRGL